MVTTDADEAEVLNAFFSLKKIYRDFVPTYRIWEGEEQPIVEEVQVR